MNPQFGSGQPISARCQLGQLNDWGDSVIRGLTQAHVRLLSGGDPISSGWESEPLSICSSIWSLQPGGSRGDLTCCSEIPGACPKTENCISISPDITAEAVTGSPDPGEEIDPMLHGRVSTSPPGGGRCSPTGQCSHLWEIHLAAPCPLPQKIRGGKSNQPESICPPPRGSLSPCTVLGTGQGADIS